MNVSELTNLLGGAMNTKINENYISLDAKSVTELRDFAHFRGLIVELVECGLYRVSGLDFGFDATLFEVVEDCESGEFYFSAA